MPQPKYPKHCVGYFDHHNCRSKRFERTEEDNRYRWTCMVKKCRATWTVAKEGTHSK